MNKSNWLGGLFRWLKDVIEEADKPLNLLITILLPFIAPIIPSIITAGNLQKYMLYTSQTSYLAAIAFALVGYVAMVSAIGNITTFVENETSSRNWFPMFVSIGSYSIYVVALVLVNVILEYNHNVEGTQIAVTAVMTLGLEIPSALLNGTRISYLQKQRQLEDSATYAQQRELTALQAQTQAEIAVINAKAKARADLLTLKNQSASIPTPKSKAVGTSPSAYRDEIWKLFDRCWTKTNRPAQIKEITVTLNLDYKTSSGYIHGQKKLWATARGVDLSKFK